MDHHSSVTKQDVALNPTVVVEEPRLLPAFSAHHAEKVLAIDAGIFDHAVNLVKNNGFTWEELLEDLPKATAFVPRWIANQGMQWLQLIPYVILRRRNEEQYEYLVYQRSKMNGEERMIGNNSIGFGGHVELTDASYPETEIITSSQGREASWGLPYLSMMLKANLIRELSEELSCSKGDYNYPVVDELYDLSDENCLESVAMVIRSKASNVDRSHLGLVFVVDIEFDDELVFTANSPDLEILGWKTQAEIQEMGVENWSDLYIKENYGLTDLSAPAEDNGVIKF